MIKESIGLTFMALGVSTAGSNRIAVPLILMGIGLFLIRGLVEW